MLKYEAGTKSTLVRISSHPQTCWSLILNLCLDLLISEALPIEVSLQN